jgi:hypothetical protein
MNKSLITIIFSFIIIFFLSLTSSSEAQSDFGVGLNLGGGTIGGNLPTQGAFASSIFIEANPGFKANVLTRLSFIYDTDINILFPKTRGRYYPFIKGISLKAVTSQTLSDNIYIEEGLGPLLLNDRTFDNINEWDLGIGFSIASGFDLRDAENNGFKIGVGTEYGLTFTNTNVRNFSVYFNLEYIL